MRKTILFLLVGQLIFSKSIGQDTTRCDGGNFKDNLLDNMVGQWNLTGKIGDRKVENDFSAQWVLHHQFMELNFVDLASPPNYSAKVSIGYDCISERYVALVG